MLARAIATEAGATFFDLSPKVIEGKSTNGKLGAPMLIYKTFLCAQDMAPSVVYFDECELIFQAAKKKKGGDANAPSRIKKDLQAAIKQVKRGPDSTDQDRILFIGCTSKPFDPNADEKALAGRSAQNAGDKADGTFDEKIWVNFPEYGSRVLLWQRFMEQHGVIVDHSKFHIGALATVSLNYSAGSIKQTVNRVLTTRRVQKLKDRPLREDEFIGPLSRTNICFEEDYLDYRTFSGKTEAV
jgi:SpoVK/Ycf46/Vps4 family AAA+-type ATPase